MAGQPSLWPNDNAFPTKNGLYVRGCHAKTAKEDEKMKVLVAAAEGDYETWYRTPAFSQTEIDRIKMIQLRAESFERGIGVPAFGIWTSWFELSIVGKGSDEPRVQGGVTLTWRSHKNESRNEDALQEKDAFQEGKGKAFGSDSYLLRSLQEGDSLVVRLCVQHKGWELHARKGLLILDFGEAARKKPMQYGSYAVDASKMDALCRDVNRTTLKEGELPDLPSSVFEAWRAEELNKPALRVLALDGGGVRGLASLYILDKVMSKAFGDDYEVRGGCSPEKPCPHPTKCKFPSHYFDMIAGTSTGGLIAIMLGRLGMGVRYCIEKYKQLMPEIFPDGKAHEWYDNVFKRQEKWDHEVLERVIYGIIRARFPDAKPEDVPLMNGMGTAGGVDMKNKARCKVFVTAARKTGSNRSPPVLLRSYVNPTLGCNLPSTKIWKAARATSAAPWFFNEIEIEDEITKEKMTLIDGGVQANNPLGWVWNEILTMYGPYRTTSCFLSIGTGVAPSSILPAIKLVGKGNGTMKAVGSILYNYKENMKIASALKEGYSALLTNTELTNVMFRTLINNFAPATGIAKYFRFNVADDQSPDDFDETHGENDKATVKNGGITGKVRMVEMDESSNEAMEKIKKQVGGYLAGPLAVQVVEACALALNPGAVGIRGGIDLANGNAVHANGNAVHENGNAVHENGNAVHENGNAVHENGNAAQLIDNAVELNDNAVELNNNIDVQNGVQEDGTRVIVDELVAQVEMTLRPV